MITGLREEYTSPKQYIHTPSIAISREPIGRAIPLSPILWQGKDLACVACSITCLANYEQPEVPHEWQELHHAVDVRGEGVKPSEALEYARRLGWIDSYFRVSSVHPDALYDLLREHPIMVGLPVHEIMWAGTSQNKPLTYDGVRDYGHMCVLWDVTEKGDWIVLNWAKEKTQDWRVLARDYPIDVAYFVSRKENAPKIRRIGWLQAAHENARRFFGKLV